MTSAWLSRVEVRTDAGLAALGPLLMPAEDNARTDAAHRLVWTLFADHNDRKRDFLWREESAGRFFVLSKRRPDAEQAVLHVESKPFEPSFSAGDRLGFMMRANPTIAPRGPDRRRSDVVMHALHRVPPGPERAAHRPTAIRRASVQWLERTGARCGFSVDAQTVSIDGYQTRRLPRPDGKAMCFSTLDFQGFLKVDDPRRFLAAVLDGFGRARGFGCGLMLLRRV